MSEPTTRPRYPFWQVLVTLLLGPIGVGIVGSLVVSLLVAAAVVGTSGQGFAIDSIQKATMSFPVIATSLAMTTLGFIGGPYLLARVTKRSPAETLGLNTRPHIAALLLAPIGTLALGPTSDRIVQLAQRFIPTWTFGAIDQIEEIARRYPAWMLIPFLAFCPGFGEEIVFRGFIQRWIGKGALAIAISGISFAAIHVDPHHVLGVIPLGLYLAWVADRTNSTWPTIAAHVTNNAVAVIAVKVLGTSTPQQHATIAMVIGGLAVSAATMVAIAKVTGAPATEAPPLRSIVESDQ